MEVCSQTRLKIRLAGWLLRWSSDTGFLSSFCQVDVSDKLVVHVREALQFWWNMQICMFFSSKLILYFSMNSWTSGHYWTRLRILSTEPILLSGSVFVRIFLWLWSSTEILTMSQIPRGPGVGGGSRLAQMQVKLNDLNF